MTTRPRLVTLLLAASLALAATACGGDPEVTTVGTEDDGSGDASGSGSGSGSGSAVAAAEQDCASVNAALEDDADETVDIALTDYAFEPDEVEVAAGTVTFATTNEGTEAHEFAVLPGGGEVPLTADGAPDEDALADAGAFEMEAYGPGQTCNATWELEPGEYTLFCIVEAPDGETHAAKGMVGSLTVTG